ncbi:AfsR/SARP family transcriptional regulator [Kineococcus rhizosphaerae]|nr:BTAD domain-containing putative transcriptional regulator [Kineococcus rhizosphaerae]
MESGVRLLGPVQLVLQGAVVPLRSAQQRSLVAVLAIHAGLSVSMDRLVSALWDDPPRSAVNAVQGHVSSLRRAMGAQATMLKTVAGGYSWSAPSETVDVHVFEQLVHRGADEQSRGRSNAALEAYEGALRLWQDPPLADVGAAPFTEALVPRLRSRWLDAVVGRAAVRVAQGQARHAVIDLRPMVLEHPGDERVAGALISALASAGEQAEALRVYGRLRETLADELGADPSPQLQVLHRDLLLQRLPATPAVEVRPSQTTVLRTSQAQSYAPELIGRQRELRELTALVRRGDHRVVSVTGTAGTGKSRLCAAVARAMEEDFSDGVLHIGLADVREPDGLLMEIHAAADLPSDPTPFDARRLARAFKGRQVLLVIDDFEHLSAAAPLLADFLRLVPTCRALVSTRAKLRVSGEFAYRLEPLKLPGPTAAPEEVLASPAVQLFCERATAASGYRPDLDDAAYLNSICTRLDGLPLALELAAARTTVYALPTLLTRLDNCLAELTGGPRDVPAHQRALRATLEWSTELLEPGTSRALAALSVFPSSWTLNAAAQVGHLEHDEARDIVTDLLDNSLVQPAGPDRFRMLTVVRDFASTLLTEDQRAVTRSAMADWAVELSRTLQQGRQEGLLTKGEWSAIFKPEEANLISAVDWCIQEQDTRAVTLVGALWYFFYYDGTTSRWTGWVQGPLPTAQAHPDDLYRLARALGGVAISFADPHSAVKHYRQALSGLPPGSHDLERALLRRNEAIAVRFTGELVLARELMEQALASLPGQVQQLNDDLTELAEMYAELGDRDLALNTLRRCAQQQVEGDHETAAYICAGRAMLACQDNAAEAAMWLTRLSEHLVDEVSLVVRIDVQHMAAIVRLVLDEVEEAWALLRWNVRTMPEVGYYLFAPDTASLAALLLHRRGHVTQALPLTDHGARFRKDLGLFMAYRPLRELHDELQRHEYQRPNSVEPDLTAGQAPGDVESLSDLVQLLQVVAAHPH